MTWSVTYEDIAYTKTVKFTVLADVLKTISVTKEPTKTQYVAGETFDATGMEVTATYESGKTVVVSDYTVDKTTLEADDTSVVISYQDKKTVLPVTVTEKQEENNGGNSSNSSDKEKNGCASVSAMGAITVCLMAGIAIGKKRKEN